MAEERRRSGFDLDSFPPIQGERLSGYLDEIVKSPEDEYFEFPVENLTAGQLHSLVHREFEVGLTEYKDRIIVTTGDRQGVDGDARFMERRDCSGLALHVHMVSEANFPIMSNTDIRTSQFRRSERAGYSILVHPEGILVYQRPVNDPRTGGRVSNAYVLDFIEAYGEMSGINIGWLGSSMPHISTLPATSRISLLRDFAEKTGMILDEARWDDASGVSRLAGKYMPLIRPDC